MVSKKDTIKRMYESSLSILSLDEGEKVNHSADKKIARQMAKTYWDENDDELKTMEKHNKRKNKW